MKSRIGEVMKETFMFTSNALYEVSSPTGLEGGQEVAEAHQTRGLASYPGPFSCAIRA